VTYGCSLVYVPQKEEEVADYDWANFPPSKVESGRSSFTIIDECTGIDGKLITRNLYPWADRRAGVCRKLHHRKDRPGPRRNFCRNLMVMGNVHANIVCDSIFVRSGGVLSAMLKYKNFKIEPGGSVGGKFERRLVIEGQSQPVTQEDDAPRSARSR
jgi:hypothetical protein